MTFLLHLSRSLSNRSGSNLLENTGSYYARTNVKLPSGKMTLKSPAQILFGDYEGCCDHINHDTLDNRRDNLRICTVSQNNMNRKKSRKTQSSIYKGVCWYARSRKWIARIKYYETKYHLGYFDSEIEAAKAYNNKARELFGEFAKLNNL